jgi:maleylacetate reductase
MGLPHAEVHAALLPEITALYVDAAPNAAERVAVALGDREAPAALRSLARDLGATRTLADMGLTADQTQVAARLAAASSPSLPRPVTEADVRYALRAAGAPR